MTKPSGKYSSRPGAPLAGPLDQSPRTHDYRPGLPAVAGLRRDLPMTCLEVP